jgi:hypothetical protein
MTEMQADAMRQTPEGYRATRESEIAACLSLAQARLLGIDQPDIRGLYEIVHNLRYARERMVGVEQIARVLLWHYQAALRVIAWQRDAGQAAEAIAAELLHDDGQMQAIEVDDLCDPQWIAAVMASGQRAGKAKMGDGTQDG